MRIAVVGRDADALCRAAGVDAARFRALSEASGRAWNLLALTRSAAAQRSDGELCAQNVLLPGDTPARLAASLRAQQAVGYGLSARDTLTFSVLSGAGRLLCLQRSVLTLDGELLEPQELPLSPAFAALSDEDALLAAGLRLLCRGL